MLIGADEERAVGDSDRGPDSFARQASGIVRGLIEAARQGSGKLRLSLALPGPVVTEALKALEKALTADSAPEISWLGRTDASRGRPALS